MKKVLLAAAFGLWPAIAFAADQPLFQPPAAWVHPATTLPNPSDAGPGGSIRVLLFDQQLHFGSEGASVYTEAVTRLETPQGVSEAGSINLPWQPETQQLTIHKLRILRGDQVIDVLARQRLAVIRRETNLEAAQVDGVLTATVQPEDLRVGDRIDFAVTVTAKDPALAGRSEAAMTPPNAAIDSLHLSAVAERGVMLQARGYNDLADTRLSSSPSGLAVDINRKVVAPLDLPNDAPARFRQGRYVAFSEFRSWKEISSVMAPLYAKAAQLRADSPVKAEAAKIRAEYKDPKDQAAAALRLVQSQVRYLALLMDDGGQAPAAADDTWSRRFGDCKGKTALLIALLNELGVPAEPAFVSVDDGDGLNERLPALGSFNHVLAHVALGGQDYWLDGARSGDWSLDGLAVPPFFWTLPLRTSGADLVRLQVKPLAHPNGVQILALDASTGMDSPARAHGEFIARGDAAVFLNTRLSSLTAAQQDTTLRAYWKKTYDFVTPASVSVHFDPQAIEERWTFDGQAAMEWKAKEAGRGRRYEADGDVLGWKPDWKRDPGPHADLPIATDFPAFSEARETIVLPNKGSGFTITGEDIDQRIGAWAFSRKSEIKDGVFTMDATQQTIAGELPAKDIQSAHQSLTDLVNLGVYVQAPHDDKPAPQQPDQLASKTPTTAEGFMRRGTIYHGGGQTKLEIADYRQAVALNPKSTNNLITLALAEINDDQLVQGRQHLDAAKALGSHDTPLFVGYGRLAMKERDYLAAAQAFDRVLESTPADRVSRGQRASANFHLLRLDQSLSDTDELLRLAPESDGVHAFRRELFFTEDQPDKALADADAELARTPDSAKAHGAKAYVLARMGRGAEADAEWKKAISLGPTDRLYLSRAESRPWADHIEILDDLNAALALNPDNRRALRWRVQTEAAMGVYPLAIGHADALVKQHPDDVDLRALRGSIFVHAGRLEDAAADYRWGRTKAAGNADDLNNLCWNQAVANTALEDALADCEAALKLAPRSAAKLDSRAFVLLRLGRYREAIETYDQALTFDPEQPTSIYGRGIAKLRVGDKAAGQADMARAKLIDPSVVNEYTGWGVQPDAGIPKSAVQPPPGVNRATRS
ncbi:MAG TPA: DUF3857 domain-containing protein [Caulobacteraceae bacterium]|nr:DUF3857 domain-containing protein [Caulobacteraceae bacterium]